MSCHIPNHDALLDDPRNRAEDRIGDIVPCGNPDCDSSPCTESEICQCGACPDCCTCDSPEGEDESRDEHLWED